MPGYPAVAEGLSSRTKGAFWPCSAEVRASILDLVNMTVEQVMTKPVHVIPAEATFKQIVAILQAHHLSGMPVVDAGGRIQGVVSEGDLLVKEEPAPRSPRFETRRDRMLRDKAQALTAGQLMTTPAITVGAEVFAVDAARTMRVRNVNRLPVVDEVGFVIGIVTRSDLLRIYLRDDDEIRHEVVGTIERLWPDRSHVHVTVKDGRIVLAGEVEHKSDIAVVCEMSARIPGAVAVDCQLDYRVNDTIRHLELPAPWLSLGLTGRLPRD